jgi:hypothetical protein
VAVDLCLSGSIENATQQDVLVNRQLKHAVKIELFGTQEVVEGLSLGNGTREPIQDEPVLGIWLQNALGNYLNDELVWNKLTTFHHRLGFSSNGSACRHGSAQHIAGRQLRNGKLPRQSGRLSSFSGSRRSQ